MDLNGISTSQSMEVISAKLAQSQQKQEGAAVAELLASAASSAPAPSNPAGLGGNIDIKV